MAEELAQVQLHVLEGELRLAASLVRIGRRKRPAENEIGGQGRERRLRAETGHEVQVDVGSRGQLGVNDLAEGDPARQLVVGQFVVRTGRFGVLQVNGKAG